MALYIASPVVFSLWERLVNISELPAEFFWSAATFHYWFASLFSDLESLISQEQPEWNLFSESLCKVGKLFVKLLEKQSDFSGFFFFLSLETGKVEDRITVINIGVLQ